MLATRGPVRPNPIAVTACGLLAVDKHSGRIEVNYLDAEPGTPVLDIKPYHPSSDRIQDVVMPAWCAIGQAAMRTAERLTGVKLSILKADTLREGAMKQALIVIDMQNGVFARRPVYRKDTLIGNVRSALQHAGDHGYPVIFSLHANNTFLLERQRRAPACRSVNGSRRGYCHS